MFDEVAVTIFPFSRRLMRHMRYSNFKADRDLYKTEMQDILLNYPNLRVVEASVEDIILSETEKVQGIKVQDGKRQIISSHKIDEI